MSGSAKDGKKGKKGKKTMPLSEFLGSKAVPDGFDKKMINWADVTEDDEMSDIPLPKFKEELILPTAPKASRPNEIDTSRVPTMPPFKAYIGNIPYGAGEEELKQFFENLHPISVQLPRDDKGTGRTRGFGYVEFETRDCLIEALKMHGSMLNDRILKVSLPEEGQRDMDGRRDRGPGMTPGDEDRTAGDWRKAPRPEQQNASSHQQQPQYQQQQQQYSSAPRPDTGREMAGPWRSAAAVPSDVTRGGQRNGYDNPPARNYEPAGGAFRESRSGYDSSYADDRRPPGGAFSDRRTGGFDNYSRGHGADDRRRDGGYENSYRDNYRDAPRQSSRYDDYNRRPAYGDRYESERGNDYDRHQRSTGGHDRPVRADPVRTEDHRSEPAAPAADEAPKTRPKLQLQPRSKPLDEIAAPAPVASRNIFGDAKPVDTARKELEVEEKLKSLDVKEPAAVVEPGRARTISSGSGSGSTSNRLRKESDTDRRDDNRTRRNDNFSRDNDFGRRNDRPAPDRGFDNRDRRPGFGNDQRRMQHDDRRRNDRPFPDRPVLNRRDDRRDDRGPVRPRPEDDRRPERRPEPNRDNNNGVKYDATKKEKDVDYTVRNKFDALNDDDFDASTRYPVHD